MLDDNQLGILLLPCADLRVQTPDVPFPVLSNRMHREPATLLILVVFCLFFLCWSSIPNSIPSDSSALIVVAYALFCLFNLTLPTMPCSAASVRFFPDGHQHESHIYCALHQTQILLPAYFSVHDHHQRAIHNYEY